MKFYRSGNVALAIVVATVSVLQPAGALKRGFLVLDSGYFFRTPVSAAIGSLNLAQSSRGRTSFWLIAIRNWEDDRGVGQGDERASVTVLDIKPDPSAASQAKKMDAESDCPPVPTWHKKAVAVAIASSRPKGETDLAVEIPAGFERDSSEAANQELRALIKAELAKNAADEAISANNIGTELKLSAKFVNGARTLWYVSSGYESSASITIYDRATMTAPRQKIAAFQFVTACTD